MAFAATSLCAAALPTGYYAKSSILSSGHWVKVRVDQEGIYRLSYDQLRQWGFADPSKVSVYGYGGAMLHHHSYTTNDADDLTRAYTYHHQSTGQMYFYGEGPDRKVSRTKKRIERQRNYYHDYGYYFLSDCEALPQPETVASRVDPYRPVLTNHLCVQIIDKDEQNPVGAGVYFHEKPMAQKQTNSYTFEIYDFDANDTQWNQPLYFNYSYGARGYSSTELHINIPSQMMCTEVEAGSCYSMNSDTQRYRPAKGGMVMVPTNSDGVITDGEYTFDVINDAADDQKYCAIDRIGFAYRRSNRLPDDGSPLIMQIVDYDTRYDFEIQNASPSTVVLNVSRPDNVYRHSIEYFPDIISVRGSLDREYLEGKTYICRLAAFDPEKPMSQVRTPEFVEQVENQDIHSMATPQMLIITTKTLEPAARELARIHKTHDGLDVLVVTQDQVFNEFSSGTPEIFAYSRVAKMFYDRDPKRFKYLLLYGAGSWDNRSITIPQTDRLLTYQCDNETYASEVTKAYSHDGFCAMLEDDFPQARMMLTRHSIAVGRIPANDLSIARQANRKIEEYLMNPPTHTAYNNIIALSDDGNGHTHLRHSEEVILKMSQIMPAATFVRAHNLVYDWVRGEAKIARDVIISQLKAGAGYFTYSGHGGPDGFTAEKLWTRSYVNSTDYNQYPLAVLSTCDSYSFDIESGGIAETMLFKEHGGMIGVIGAGRSVYMELNQQVNLAMALEYANAQDGTTIGDIYRNGHNAIMDRPTVHIDDGANTKCYNLCGDPALPVMAPSHKVSLKTVDGYDISRLDPMYMNGGKPLSTIQPRKPFEIEGTITHSGGLVDRNFTGQVTVTIYQSPDTVRTTVKNPNDKYESTQGIYMDQDIMARAYATVTKGVFKMKMTAPAPVSPGYTNRIVFTAENQDNTSRASGIYRLGQIADADTQAEPSPESAPEITQMYLDTPSFTDGGMVGKQTTMYAQIQVNEAGLNMSTSLGNGPSLVLDGNRPVDNAAAYFRADPENPEIVNVSVPLTELTNGAHSLSMTVGDNLGQRVRRTLSFVVGTNETATLAIVPTDSETARRQVTIDFENEKPQASHLRLIIEDALGNNILTKVNPTFPYTWDFKDNKENIVADGHYKAYIIAIDAHANTSSPSLEIPVVK